MAQQTDVITQEESLNNVIAKEWNGYLCLEKNVTLPIIWAPYVN